MRRKDGTRNVTGVSDDYAREHIWSYPWARDVSIDLHVQWYFEISYTGYSAKRFRSLSHD